MLGREGTAMAARRRKRDTSDTLSVPEAGKRLNVGRNQAYAAVKRGEIPIIKIGRSLRVPRPAFERLLEGR
jgi:excisionase family DNA binding protein